MTSMAISELPAAVGSATLSAFWRTFVWGLARVFRAPVASAILIAMVLGMAMAAGNALHGQTERHPAPLFAEDMMTTSSVSQQAPPAKAVFPNAVRPAPRPMPFASAPSIVTDPVQAPTPAESRAFSDITSQDIAAMQDKLRALRLYDGTTDGVYGPQTAAAIRTFELNNGMAPVGAVTPDVLRAILDARITSGPRAQAVPTPRANIGSNTATVTPHVKVEPVSAVPPTPIPAPNRAVASNQGDHLIDIVTRVATAARNTVAPAQPTSHTDLVKKIQRGLASLGFLRGKIDGVAGADTARAIRKFEVYYSYNVTGEATPELLDLLVENGAKV